MRFTLAMLMWVPALASCAGTPVTERTGATCDQFAATPIVEQTRTIDAGADLDIVLCSNPSTGFAWGDPEIGDTDVVQLIDRVFQEPQASPAIVGAPGADVLTIHGVTAGTTTVSLSYGQQWAGGTKGAWSYTLSVTVR